MSGRRHYAWTVLALCFGAILCAQACGDGVLALAAGTLAVAAVTCLALPRPRRLVPAPAS